MRTLMLFLAGLSMGLIFYGLRASNIKPKESKENTDTGLLMRVDCYKGGKMQIRTDYPGGVMFKPTQEVSSYDFCVVADTYTVYSCK